jgi:hypothetical protein
MDKNKIENILAEAVSAYRRIPKNLEVGIAIEAVTGRAVIPMSDQPADKELLTAVCAAAERLIGDSKRVPLKTGRVNELGNAIEEPLLDACRSVGLDATWPKRADGSGGRTGYPDIAIDINGERPTYLEAKAIAPNSESSSFRSFYLSPSDNPKVCIDARHLLVAFVHKRLENDADGREQYSLTNYKIVDLALACGKIKFEYQSSNKNMYQGSPVIARG